MQNQTDCQQVIHLLSLLVDLIFDHRGVCYFMKLFRECLKRADSGAANVVGKLFFNIVQAKCFDLKKEKVCNSSQWFGQCTSYEVQLRAVARDHDPY
ncbi:hypothetical protein M8J76_003361 [Diaphorina citri]|nr:hypothetical protein M8J76_003361 [Diaphorina citri]